jgi:hypothetical protein
MIWISTDVIGALRTSHAALAERVDATAAIREETEVGAPGQIRVAILNLQQAIGRHHRAFAHVVLPTIRLRVDGGAAMAQNYDEHFRALEGVLAQLHARTQGLTLHDRSSAPALWERVRRQFVDLCMLEEGLAEHLCDVSTTEDPDWVRMLQMAEAARPRSAEGLQVPRQRSARGVISTLAATQTR